MNNMTLKDFIDNYILPNEDDKVALAYYRGEIEKETRTKKIKNI